MWIGSADVRWWGGYTSYDVVTRYVVGWAGGVFIFIVLPIFSFHSLYCSCVLNILNSISIVLLNVLFLIFNLPFYQLFLIFHTTSVHFCQFFISDILVVLIVINRGLHWFTVTVGQVVAISWVNLIPRINPVRRSFSVGLQFTCMFKGVVNSIVIVGWYAETILDRKSTRLNSSH